MRVEQCVGKLCQPVRCGRDAGGQLQPAPAGCTCVLKRTAAAKIGLTDDLVLRRGLEGGGGPLKTGGSTSW